MKNNTVVTASDMNYLWGVYLLIASMRKNKMDEPVVVLADRYTDQAKQLLQQFPSVTVYDLAASKRSMTCQKPQAMLLADTQYITWVDCDGFFSGNCSEMLAPPDESHIHVRLRDDSANAMIFPYAYAQDEPHGKTPKAILAAWRQDIAGAIEHPYHNCCSACYISIPARHRSFLQLWHEQMLKVLPAEDVGVVDKRLFAYPQLDESVLNSLLAFAPDAPTPTECFLLDKQPDAKYIHFVCHPKPWVGWIPYSLRSYKEYIEVIKYVQENQFAVPGGVIPFALRPGNEWICHLTALPIALKVRGMRFLKRQWSTRIVPYLNKKK